MKYDDIDSFVEQLFDEQPLELQEEELYLEGLADAWQPDYTSAATWQPTAPAYQPADPALAHALWEDALWGTAHMAGDPHNPAPGLTPYMDYVDEDGIARLPQALAQPFSPGELLAWGALLLMALGVIVALSESGVL